MNDRDEFFLGWEDSAPPGISVWMRRWVVGLVLLSTVLALGLALAQYTIGTSVFEWGRIKQFSGRFQSQPYPQLLVARPGATGDQSRYSSYYLVRPFKFGLEPELARRLDGQWVTLRGTLIYRGSQTMIEVAEGSLRPAEPRPDQAGGNHTVSPEPSTLVGRHTFVGEIVDSKCYLGVMNPGALIPHRACAIRCISGGIPPILLVRQPDGRALHLLLVSPEGKPVNREVLEWVAEPVQVTGEVERQGELLILRADPRTIRRVGA